MNTAEKDINAKRFLVITFYIKMHCLCSNTLLPCIYTSLSLFWSIYFKQFQFEGLDKDQDEPSSRTGELIQETTTSVDSEPEENMADTVSGVVCNESDLKDGE